MTRIQSNLGLSFKEFELEFVISLVEYLVKMYIVLFHINFTLHWWQWKADLVTHYLPGVYLGGCWLSSLSSQCADHLSSFSVVVYSHEHKLFCCHHIFCSLCRKKNYCIVIFTKNSKNIVFSFLCSSTV